MRMYISDVFRSQLKFSAFRSWHGKSCPKAPRDLIEQNTCLNTLIFTSRATIEGNNKLQPRCYAMIRHHTAGQVPGLVEMAFTSSPEFPKPSRTHGERQTSCTELEML